METQDRRILWSFMILLTGAVDVAMAQSVKYPGPVCAVRTSTVVLPCTFSPRQSFTVNDRDVPLHILRVVWCQNHAICHETTPSVYDSEKQKKPSHYKYMGDMKGNCTLQISNVTQRDSAIFRFWMEANNVKGHFTEQSGVNVTVVETTEMKINSSSDQTVMKEGEAVTLSCVSLRCTIHQAQVTWFKDGHALSASGPALQLRPLTAGDSGNYTCGVKDTMALSLPYTLQVASEAARGGGVLLSVALVFGVLLVVSALLCFIIVVRRRKTKRKQTEERDVRSDLEPKVLNDIYSNILPPAEQEEKHPQRETNTDVEDVSYSFIQFKHNNHNRVQQQVDDSIIYSSVVS